MKIYLKNNWSEQFIYGDTKSPGFFVGRRHEVQALKSIIENNDSNSILISGIRGTGKTSFVHKTLSELDGGKFIPIFVNLGHVLSHLDSEQKRDKKLFINALIRALYLSGSFNGEEYKKIKKLYNISIADYKHEDLKEKTNRTELDGQSGIGLSFWGFGKIRGNIGHLFAKLTKNKETIIIDNSTEFLEIELEK